MAKFLPGHAADKRSGAGVGDVQLHSYPTEVFVGQVIDWTSGNKRTIVAAEQMSQISSEIQTQYDTKAFMTMEGLIRPVSMDGDGGLPRYVQFTATSTSPSGGTSGSGCGGVVISSTTTAATIVQDDLNPFTNPAGKSRNVVSTTRNDLSGVGHDFDILGRGSGVPSSGMIMSIANGATGTPDYQDDYRFFALRGPLVVHGWGYDTDGYPVPNKSDTEGPASSGVFESSGLHGTKFLDGHLRKPHTWPVAPVDLRLDRSRGVWVTGGASSSSSSVGSDLVQRVLVTGSYNSECCLFPAVYRTYPFTSGNYCEPEGDLVSIWLYAPCGDVAGLVDLDYCVLAKKEKDCAETDCGDKPLYIHLSTLETSNGSCGQDCSCCCPATGTIVLGRIIDTGCTSLNTTSFKLYYEEDFNLQDVSGDLWNTGSARDGWAGDLSCTTQLPVRLTELNVSITGGPTEQAWARTNGDNFTFTDLYIDDGFGDLVVTNDSFTIVNVPGNCQILTNSQGAPIYEPVGLDYKVFLECNDGNCTTPMSSILFALTTSGHPDGPEFFIPDPQSNNTPSDECILNTQRLNHDLDFGQSAIGGTAFVSTPDGSGYLFAAYNTHYFCACPCSGYEFCMDTNDQTPDTITNATIDGVQVNNISYPLSMTAANIDSFLNEVASQAPGTRGGGSSGGSIDCVVLDGAQEVEVTLSTGEVLESTPITAYNLSDCTLSLNDCGVSNLTIRFVW
jgi:hypothetical protein